MCACRSHCLHTLLSPDRKSNLRSNLTERGLTRILIVHTVNGLVVVFTLFDGIHCRLKNLSQHLTSHPGQLSLAIPPWVGAIE